MNNLEINRDNRGDIIVLICTGRLDANSAGHLNDFIERLIQEGHYHISLDLAGIEYLSSAGIRSLVTQYRNLNAVTGHFSVISMSKNVQQVLDMVGMSGMLSQSYKKTVIKEEREEAQKNLNINGINFKFNILNSEGKSNVNLYGNPELTQNSGFNSSEARVLKSEKNQFSIGLGAIGESFDECKSLFGEFIMFGNDIAYLPSDGSRKPDYMISSGKLVATLTELYGLHFEGNFSHILRFDHDIIKNTAGISQLAEGIQKYTNFSQFAFVMIAESGGLIGTSLNSSPVGGKNLFKYPDVKDTINFTTEPAYIKMLTLSVGLITSDKNENNKRFLRTIHPHSQFLGHVHTAVFPFIPLKKNDINLYETINYLLENVELKDILHLTNDSREIVGLGESQFVHGTCWIVPIESVKLIANK